MKPLKRTLAAAIVIVLVCAALYLAYYEFGPEAQRPNPLDVRRYVITQLSDAQIRTASKQAEHMEAKAIADAKTQEAEREVERQTRAAKEANKAVLCADDVYRTRNPDDCSSAHGFVTGDPLVPAPYIPTKDELIDRILYGDCLAWPTIRDARANHCLPPR